VCRLYNREAARGKGFLAIAPARVEAAMLDVAGLNRE